MNREFESDVLTVRAHVSLKPTLNECEPVTYDIEATPVLIVWLEYPNSPLIPPSPPLPR
jgi:hypothetical protein